MHIKTFAFNPLQVNTYILYDDSNYAIIVDPSCYGEDEEKILDEFIFNQHLEPKIIVITHAHADHILGINYVMNKYNTQFLIHKQSKYFIENADKWALMLGLNIKPINPATKFLEEKDIIETGNISLEVLYTPGHAEGSICLLDKTNKFVITGDVLFSGSIGRTDLPTGDYDVLKKNIKDKLFTLSDEFIVYPGHGPATSIGHEKQFNPFL